ncbi:uncharacterized protein LOC133198441 [Saccostrea echinata]|uniref:uncharacterized protein LOC133198441 n=1 Tax=Saccostrea echinata TaxID=191078 RepID=UPI002A7F1FCA|nr:uncharacterized protein LOC133198441 [Saccostrea echinata]
MSYTPSYVLDAKNIILVKLATVSVPVYVYISNTSVHLNIDKSILIPIDSESLTCAPGFSASEVLKWSLGFVNVSGWCFSFHKEPTSMLNSSDICHQQGAHMVVLDSEVKEKVLTKYIEKMNFFNIYQERNELFKIAQREWDVETEKKNFCADYIKHGVKSSKYRHIPNAKIPLGSLPHQRANLTTPPGFSIKISSLPGAGMGAWAETFVPKFTILWVYEGLIHTVDRKDDYHPWQLLDFKDELIVTRPFFEYQK